MKLFTKFAAAAIVIIGVIAIFLFNSGPGSVALADVYAKVQQTQAFMYKMSMTMNGSMMEGMPPQNMEMEMTAIISAEHGMKMESTTHLLDQNQTMSQQMYMIPDQKVMIMLMPDQKQYMRMEFTEELLTKTKQQNNDPREMIKRMLEHEYVDLGFSEIDGITVQGFQTTDPAYFGGVLGDAGSVTLWVDAKSWLPVRSEVSFKMGDAMEARGVLSDFQWDVTVEASEFEPVIPEDYQSMGSMKMPEMTEEAALNGLKIYLQYTDAYPEKIDITTLATSFAQLLADTENEATREIRERIEAAAKAAEGDFSKVQEITMEFMAPIQSLGMFYMTLVQEKRDPAYYGDQVTPEDTDKVLLRWKLDNGQYRVVFGDLTVTEMEYDKLKEIEPQPEPVQP